MSWHEISPEDLVREVLPAHVESTAKVLDLLMVLPNSTDFLDVRPDEPIEPGHGYLVPRTRYFFNVSEFRKLRGDAVTILLTFGVTQSVPISSFIAVAVKVLSNGQTLTPDEVELVSVILQTSDLPYKDVVTKERLFAAYHEATVSVNGLLESLVKKGVLIAKDDHYRLVK